MELVSSCGDHQPSSSALGARGSPEPPWPYGEPRSQGELGKRCDPQPRHIGAEVCSLSTVSLCRMQLLQASFVPFRSYAIGGPTLALGYRWVDRARTIKAFLCQIRLLSQGEYSWSWFSAAETTSQAALPTETEAAQSLLGPMGSLRLGEN